VTSSVTSSRPSSAGAPIPPGRSLVGLCAALLDLGPVEARAAAEEVSELLGALPSPARGAMTVGAMAVDALTVVCTGRRLDRLPSQRRQALVDRLIAQPIRAALVDAVKVPVLLAHGAATAAAELAGRDPGPPARPDPPLDVTPSSHWPSRTTADVVVVGSGAGGAMVARTLARAGLVTVVLEEGRRFTVEEFRTRPALERFTALYRDGGATVALGRPPVALPIGRGVGGTTLVNSGTCYRTPAAVLRSWRDDHGVALADPAAFDPLLDEVETTLQVAAVPDAVMGENGRIALRGAATLGWSAHPLRRNAPGCGGCCQCAIGCPRNAKAGVHLSVLPDACAAGARIVTHARAERLLHGGGRVTGVRARRPDGSVLEILADQVVVAAGATETPALLRRSGLGRHPALGRNLAVHPAVSAAGWFEEPVHATRGVLQSAGIDELHAEDGILIEATSTPPGMGSMVLPGAGRALADQLARADHLATLGAMIADGPNGRVHGATRPVIRYDLPAADARRLVRSIEAMGRVLFAAGATAVVTGIPGYQTVRDVAELQAATAAARPDLLHLAAFHPTGTARMGADADRHPVDAEGRLRGVHGVWVADASVLPTCPEVNPQVSIMALALAIAGRCAAAVGAVAPPANGPQREGAERSYSPSC
jgi:choline dehydrogenase-like flavoprotein